MSDGQPICQLEWPEPVRVKIGPECQPPSGSPNHIRDIHFSLRSLHCLQNLLSVLSLMDTKKAISDHNPIICGLLFQHFSSCHPLFRYYLFILFIYSQEQLDKRTLLTDSQYQASLTSKISTSGYFSWGGILVFRLRGYFQKGAKYRKFGF